MLTTNRTGLSGSTIPCREGTEYRPCVGDLIQDSGGIQTDKAQSGELYWPCEMIFIPVSLRDYTDGC